MSQKRKTCRCCHKRLPIERFDTYQAADKLRRPGIRKRRCDTCPPPEKARGQR